MNVSADSQPRRLMQVTYSLLPGGSQRLACDLALRLDPSRVRSSICALTEGGPLAEALAEGGVPSYVVGCAPGRQWRVVPRLYRLFRETRADLVQTHHLKQLLYSALGARLAGATLIHVEHEYLSLRQPRARRYLRGMAPLCHHIVAVGEEVRAFLVREVGLPPSKISVITNGVDVERYAPRPRAGREVLGLPPGDRLIGHVARLEAEKDQAGLLHAFRIVLNACPDARLVLVGDGSRRGELHRLAWSLGIAGRVDFLGFRQDVADLLPHLDVFVLSSAGEGLPISMLEAMACERPVVVTALGEIPRVLHDGVTGMMVPPGDPAALARAVTTVLQDPRRARAMGAAARRRVAEAFNLTRVVGQYQALYDALAPDRESRAPSVSSSSPSPSRIR